MPGLPDDKVTISVILEKKAVEEIDKIANKLGLSRSKMVRNLTYMGLDDARLLNKLHIYDAVVSVQILRKFLTSSPENEEPEQE